MSWRPERVLVYRKDSDAPTRRKAKASSAAPERERIGVWDLDATAGALPRLLDIVEEAQTYFSFFSVEAPFQTGLNLPGDHVAWEYQTRTGASMLPAAAAVNVAARPIFAAAEPVLAALPIDWLVVIVRSMISDTSEPEDSWYNLFSTASDRTGIVSTFGLREYAAQAGRPFEAAVLINVLSVLLMEMAPQVDPQQVSTGSIFDFCENRDDIVLSLRKPTIDPDNRERMPEYLVEASEQVLSVIRGYKGFVGRTRPRTRQSTDTAAVLGLKAVKAGAAKSKPKAEASAVPRTDVDFRSAMKALSASLSANGSKRRAGSKKKSRPAGTAAKRGK